VLVATTVVEVGVDVPAADHHGDRERRALRPRAAASAARPHRPRQRGLDLLLLYHEPLGEMAAARLKVIRETVDGFRIAERTCGCAAKARCSARGRAPARYRIARPEVHAQLIAQARDEAVRIMQDNPKLEGTRGEALRCLLYLFERDEAVPLIGAG